ncbi:hypothetical protein Y1Q_0016557 [Alligator mississippiensis]|uniref:Uncharacterized protein n=1 Tax=Alligator mississippiensis TaxID=8496 RepID=A0A151N3D4_ALLMI|nr:hypothetical protein Y1Q_0016557 [Alligator mississippiensis]
MCVPQDLYTATRLDFIVLGCNPVSYLSHPGTDFRLAKCASFLHIQRLKASVYKGRRAGVVATHYFRLPCY